MLNLEVSDEKNVTFFLSFAQNIDRGYTLQPPHYRLSESVLTSVHNLCFRAKIRKKCISCKPQFYYIKVGCKPQFYYIKLGCKGSILHGNVIVM